ncbi:hypothetical protein TL16_g02983, partial [Triparma laevis f. inornata]
SSALIAGMVCGQLLFGSLGDIMGLDTAMAATITTQLIGSALSFEVPNSISIFTVLTVWRFVLGVGCGGVYPLAASMASSSTKNEKDRGQSVALVFSMQGVGYLIPPLLCLLLGAIFGASNTMIWRLLLGFGFLPAFYLMYLRRKYKNEDKNEKKADHTTAETLSPAKAEKGDVWNAIKSETNLARKVRNCECVNYQLVGTAGSWLLFDILFYGNTLFQPVVLTAAFGDSEDVMATAVDTTIINLLSLPGYFVSVYFIGKLGPKYIQAQGFIVMAVLYFVIGFGWNSIKNTKVLLLLLYGGTFFFANFGPNSTTFVLPSMTYSPKCRSTLNGVSAAAGKLGAFLGATMFEPLSESMGNDTIMIFCGVIALVSFLITLW